MRRFRRGTVAGGSFSGGATIARKGFCGGDPHAGRPEAMSCGAARGAEVEPGWGWRAGGVRARNRKPRERRPGRPASARPNRRRRPWSAPACAPPQPHYDCAEGYDISEITATGRAVEHLIHPSAGHDLGPNSTMLGAHPSRCQIAMPSATGSAPAPNVPPDQRQADDDQNGKIHGAAPPKVLMMDCSAA